MARRPKAFDHSKYANWIDPAKVVPYERNAKVHTDKQIANIVTSIKRFGWQQDTVLTTDNVLVIGHGRRLAALKIGCEMPYHVIDKTADELTDEDIRELRIADNQTNAETGLDFETLEIEIEDLDFDGFDFDFGIEIDADEPELEAVEDDFDPTPPESPVTKPGDIYRLGRHRLMCGDSTDPAVIDRLMDGVKADMVFTDPPYGYNYQSNMRTKTEKFDVLENDDKILDFFPNLLGRVKGFVMICTTWKVLDKWLPLFKQYFDLSNMIIWDKGGGGIGDLKHTFSTDYEVILCANNGEEIREKRIGSVWSIGKDNANDYEHPTQKPVALSANAIRHTTDKEQVILDCFGGSGSTLIACEQLNRKCYMCELDPKYCDVIVDRWERLTGEKAVLIQ